MRLLLDTHIWLWGLLAPDRLSRRVRSALGNARAEVWLSPISVWETLMLVEKGRLELDRPAASWVEEALRASALREAPLTHAVVLALAELDLPHADPADRLLAATARALDLTLVTADERLIAARSVATLTNR